MEIKTFLYIGRKISVSLSAGNLMVNRNKYLQAEMKSCILPVSTSWGNAVDILCVASRHISFAFCVLLQMYAGLNHVIVSRFILKEPNSLTERCKSPMTEDSHLEER